MKAAAWLFVYLGLVLAPLLALLVAPVPAGGGFLWDLSMALGFAGLAMMAMQFLLTARFKRATAPFGIDIIYYFHRYLGVVILAIVLAHPVLLVIDNPALAGWLNPFEAPPHIADGVWAVVALLVVMITSLARKALRLPYEAWRVIHLAGAVVAVGFAFWHIDAVRYYLDTPWKRGVWLAIAATWIAVVVYVRVYRPWQTWRHPYRVEAVAPERGDAWTLTLAPEGHPGWRFQPGQFVWLTLRASPFVMREHPFSLSSSAERADGRVTVTIKALGDFTNTIGSVTPGETAYVDGPYGAFSIDRVGHPAPDGFVFIAGGIGVAPLMSMVRTLADRGDTRPVRLVYAYRRWERMTFREEIDALGVRLDLRFIPVLEEPPDDWTGERGWITADLLARHLPEEAAARAGLAYFVCGPEAMTQSVERQLAGLGVPASRVHSELFDLV